MIVLIAAYLASQIPALLLYLWLKRQKNMPDGYAGRCKKALINGMLCTFPVILMSFILSTLGRLLHFSAAGPVIYRAYYTFFVLALSEELMKFLAMKKVIKGLRCSWLEVTIYMMLSALGFQVLESVIYAFGSGPIHMFVRGITLMHVGFGFIIGYFYGRAKYFNNKAFAVVGFVISWMLHGLYDWTLSEEVLALDDMVAAIPVSLAVFCAVLVFVIIRFVIKARKKEQYMTICEREV